MNLQAEYIPFVLNFSYAVFWDFTHIQDKNSTFSNEKLQKVEA